MHAQSSVPSKHPEHMHQELLHTLSIYASVSYAHAQHKRKNSRLEKVPSKHAEHTHKELMRSLSFCVRNCCSSSSCASEIKWRQAPPKIIVTSLYFTPTVTYPERFYCVKSHENPWNSERSKISFFLSFSLTAKAPRTFLIGFQRKTQMYTFIQQNYDNDG